MACKYLTEGIKGAQRKASSLAGDAPVVGKGRMADTIARKGISLKCGRMTDRSGIAVITKFDAAALAGRIAGEVKGFNVEDYIPAQDAPPRIVLIKEGP